MSRVLLVSGSVAYPAHTTALIENIALLLENKGFKTTIWDLYKRALPIADPVYHYEPHKHPNATAREFIELASEADAFVLGSPNYHNSYSGVLKNALDILDMDMFRDKPVGLVGNGGGIRSTYPLDHLRIVVRGLSGLAIPSQIASCKSDFELVDNRYIIKSDDINKRIELFVNQLVLYTTKLK